MIIDFHTHIFPEKIAERALNKLASVINLEPSINGCAQGLLSSMENAGIDVSVVLPVVTSVDQFDSILRFAALINDTYRDQTSGRLISLAGIHPDDPGYLTRLSYIAKEGFAGIKVHPNYQGVDFSDLRFKRIIYRASELGLLILTHAGYDPLTPQREYCTPDMILDVIKDTTPEKLILAHMGNNIFYDEAEEKLCGQNVYLDTAYSIIQMPTDQMVRMIRKHGADKVLFASDCPWSHQKECVQVLENCGLSQEEKEKIFYRNAKHLLNL